MSLTLACLCAQVWYDNRASDLTKEGMLKGIERAAAFLLVSVGKAPQTQLDCGFSLLLRLRAKTQVPLGRRPPAPLLPDGDQARPGAQEASYLGAR